MKVTLIATVLDASDHVGTFLDAVRAQTRRPDEVVIVDGGSTDGTLEILRAADDITLVEEPGANISRGRNVAIARATHETIAVADADCDYGPDWLAALITPLEKGADVSMGWTTPSADSLLGICVASIMFPLDASSTDEASFMPSARSVAFGREAISAVGGYPEWLAIGEDMWVNHRWRERGLVMRFAPDAVAIWRPRPTLAATWTQFFRYARGDAQAGMYPERHAIRFATYAGVLAGLSSRRRWPKLLMAGGAAAYAREPVARARARGAGPVAVVAVPALMAFIDVAKMAGYLAGLADRLRRPGQYS